MKIARWMLLALFCGILGASIISGDSLNEIFGWTNATIWLFLYNIKEIL